MEPKSVPFRFGFTRKSIALDESVSFPISDLRSEAETKPVYLSRSPPRVEAIRFRGDKPPAGHQKSSTATATCLLRRPAAWLFLAGRAYLQHGVGDDRLSTLPDDILVDILNRLDIRDAARSSVLSRRWQHLPAMLSRIKIDVFAFRPEDNPTFCLDEIVRINAVVAEATKSILARRDSSRKTISSLCMDFFLREDDSISIGNAVGRTMLTHKVDIAEFTVLTEKNDIGCDDDDLVRYGRQFRLFFDACPIAFGGLTHLRLMNLSLSELDISNVLITCKRLKKLRFLNCDSGNPTVLQVEHAHLCELAILDCSFERVELKSLPKLKRMTFDGWISYEDPLSIGYVPLLEALSLNNICLSWHKMVKLSRFLVGTSLRDLKLGFECEKIWVQPEHLTKRQASVFSQPTKFFVSR
ncbi:hypothetical protein BRADI_2g43846v3 [Brachypodium distachyon]|uniref:F-box domain-containing protein n=1 Tax=Brachypodium distachyon TaxID=15368 RepID=A0A2K2DDR3_BRADI|nr:hypothetical protein BRADI_2g43846v3 [Brachypodium distachyon]